MASDFEPVKSMDLWQHRKGVGAGRKRKWSANTVQLHYGAQSLAKSDTDVGKSYVGDSSNFLADTLDIWALRYRGRRLKVLTLPLST